MIDEENRNHRLVELTGSDYEIVDGEPDIIGWIVKDEQGIKIGEVSELLIDEQSQSVRYIVVDVGCEDLAAPLDKEILIPIEIATFNQEASLGSEIGSPWKVGNRVNPANIPFNDGTKPVNQQDFVIVPITLQQIVQLPVYDPDFVSLNEEITIKKVFENTAIRK